MTEGWAVVVDCLAWTALSVVIGFGASRLPLRSIDHDTALTRLRPWEADGRWYEHHLAVRRWKDRLPEAGAVFGGRSKRHLPSRATADLERFAAETRRAELTHWALLCCGPLFFAWNPWWLGLVMVAFAVAFNLPFIVIQRYNRARLGRLLGRRRRFAERSSAVVLPSPADRPTGAG